MLYCRLYSTLPEMFPQINNGVINGIKALLYLHRKNPTVVRGISNWGHARPRAIWQRKLKPKHNSDNTLEHLGASLKGLLFGLEPLAKKLNNNPTKNMSEYGIGIAMVSC